MAATNTVYVDFVKIYTNLPTACYNAIEMCNFLLQNSEKSDFPPQLLRDVKRILIPQTDQLHFIATSVTDPNETQREKIMKLIVGLYGEYYQVIKENESYIQNKISDNPEIQRALGMVMTLRDLSIRHQQGRDTQPTQLQEPPPPLQPLHAIQPPPPQPQPITFDDVPPRNDVRWTKRVWEKACEVFSSFMLLLQHVFRSITCGRGPM